MRNPRSTRIMRPADAPVSGDFFERRALRFLMQAPLVRRKGRWRFGTAFVRDAVIDRLAEQGRVDVASDQVTLRIAPAGGA